ncbi:MAG TPA: hypothetical protein VMB27_17430 [Solirubrobacteraceae bacterium]|nr:hypothetical protein [Solirubrobacteraceae bacterium]
MSAGRPAPNGKPWTADYASSNGASSRAPSAGPGRLVVLGYITAFALPLLGLFLGIVVATRPAPATARHGRWIIGISIVASVIWVLVFTSGVLTSTTNDMGY